MRRLKHPRSDGTGPPSTGEGGHTPSLTLNITGDQKKDLENLIGGLSRLAEDISKFDTEHFDPVILLYMRHNILDFTLGSSDGVKVSFTLTGKEDRAIFQCPDTDTNTYKGVPLYIAPEKSPQVYPLRPDLLQKVPIKEGTWNGEVVHDLYAHGGEYNTLMTAKATHQNFVRFRLMQPNNTFSLFMGLAGGGVFVGSMCGVVWANFGMWGIMGMFASQIPIYIAMLRG